ncbi:LOW QUALITY PROTEIN: hypothetical protein SETIT_2G153900v2 [Setaria italica]|uniref:Uncharacterized protein n=1 Tax=Setaria italica TaxID=4555 RepID=A0A368PZF1_SETIT|nr:LOW QUALITY PROTEIN: hypothetical protein SETIT_2G153900v2 [Setaria italica]
MAGSTRVEMMTLFQSLLRSTNQFSNYNIRDTRAADDFRMDRALADALASPAAFAAEGKKQLEVSKQRTVALYAPQGQEHDRCQIKIHRRHSAHGESRSAGARHTPNRSPSTVDRAPTPPNRGRSAGTGLSSDPPNQGPPALDRAIED